MLLAMEEIPSPFSKTPMIGNGKHSRPVNILQIHLTSLNINLMQKLVQMLNVHSVGYSQLV